MPEILPVVEGKNTFKIPVKEGCTGEMYYFNPKTGKKADFKVDKDYVLINKAWRPKYPECPGKPVLSADKKSVLYFEHKTDAELHLVHPDCVKIAKAEV